jgi:hypothetical protein
MGLSYFVQGRRPLPPPEEPLRRNTRRADAPCFVSSHDEPNPGDGEREVLESAERLLPARPQHAAISSPNYRPGPVEQ